MKKAAIIVAIVIFGALPAPAQGKYIGMTRAKRIALQRVKGQIKGAELEKEHGKMIYSFDIRRANGGITEVNINAYTGKVIAVETESAKDEAREKKEEMKEKKKP